MTLCGVLRRGAVLTVVLLALSAGTVRTAHASTGCPAYSLGQPFLPWLDVMSYTQSPNGGLETGSTSWSLSGGAGEAGASAPWRLRRAYAAHEPFNGST